MWNPFRLKASIAVSAQRPLEAHVVQGDEEGQTHQSVQVEEPSTPREASEGTHTLARGDIGGGAQTISDGNNSGGDQRQDLVERLKACGIAGVVSYGILNTVYYLGAFLVMFLKVSPLQRGAGYVAAAKHCTMLLALVWAGSQVTKLPRMLCALFLTPWIDKGLQWLTANNRVKSKSSALALAATVCFGTAGFVFLALIALWA